MAMTMGADLLMAWWKFYKSDAPCKRIGRGRQTSFEVLCERGNDTQQLNGPNQVSSSHPWVLVLKKTVLGVSFSWSEE
jgi:hypothetical protein